MRWSKWRGHETGFGGFLLGSGTAMITNLVTQDVERWPGMLQPAATYAPAIGATLIVGVGARAAWKIRRNAIKRPQWTGGNPYPGLDAYTERWPGVFFGRSVEVHELLLRLRDARAPRRRFVAVVGPSGSGKSSVVLAGVAPMLGVRWRMLPVLTPGTHPIGELGSVLGVDLASSADAALAAAQAGKPAPRLDTALRALHEIRAGARRLLIIVDQLEEAVTQAGQADRFAFLALLEALLEQEPRLRVVATVRSDAIGSFQQGPGRGLFQDPLMVNVMGPHEIRLVVREPARLTSTMIDDDLVEEMVRDAGGGDALPLLSYLLSDLYRNLARDRRISWREYRDSGGVSGAIARRADAAVLDVGADALELCLDTLLLFVTLGTGGATRQRVLGSSLDDRQRGVVQAFVDARLMVSDESAGSTVYDLAHEALLRQWEPLAAHIVRHEEVLRRLTELGPMARAWQRSGRRSDYLLTGQRLTEALRSRDVNRLRDQPDTDDFLAASVRHDRSESQQRANFAAEVARRERVENPELALALARAAVIELAPTGPALAALRDILGDGLRYKLEQSSEVHAVGVTRDGSFAAATDTGTISVFNAAGELQKEHRSVSFKTKSLAYAIDGTLIVAGFGTIDGLAADVADLHIIAGARSVAASIDGRIATGYPDGTVRILRSGTQAESGLKLHKTEVNSLAFGMDGTLASGAEDGSLHILASDGSRKYIKSHESRVWTVAVTPQGLVVTGSDDGAVKIWNRDGTNRHILEGQGGRILAVSSLGADRIASASSNGTICLWEANDGSLSHRLPLGGDWMRSIATTLDGRLVAGCDDRTLQVWDLDRTPNHQLTQIGNLGAAYIDLIDRIDPTYGVPVPNEVRQLIERANACKIRGLTAEERRKAMLPTTS